MRILDSINNHDDLKKLNTKEQEQLCGEIRQFLVESVAKTGGHLASNLGLVELSVALETVYDTRTDRIVFDVGHQAYIHKLLTGRREQFATLRQFGGMAGFPKPCESQTDAFIAGHASESISVALGMARARTLQNENYHVVAVIGDGATTGGLAYEGLNDAGAGNEPMLIILNDNKMSINRNVGGLSRHLRQLRTKERYLGMKKNMRNALSVIPGGNWIYSGVKRVKDRLKQILLPTTMFETMGLHYLGPVDGHNLPQLISVLESVKDDPYPVVLHVITKKGKGYAPAENDPFRFHGIGKFDAATGITAGEIQPDFSEAFGKTMVKLAEKNNRVCAITAAMPGGTGLLAMQKAFPKRVFDVGIAEEHAVSLAGGLAKQGMIPVVALYSTFLQRAYDMVFQDVGMLHLHVVLAVDRAGIVGADGETHQGIYDLGFLRQVPGMKILCPASCAELTDMLTWAVEDGTGPVAIRYPRGGDRSYTDSAWNGEQAVCCHRTGKDAVLITYGILIENVMQAAAMLSEHGTEVTVLRLMCADALPMDELISLMPENADVFIFEEISGDSGLGKDLSWQLSKKAPGHTVFLRDLGKQYLTHGSVDILYRECGLDGESIAEFVRKGLS